MRYVPGTAPVLDDYPELNAYPEFAGIMDDTLKYLLFRYDPNCEAVMKVPTDQRNYVAANLSSISADEADHMSSGHDDLFNSALTRYFRLIGNRKWEIWVSGEIALNELLAKVRKPIKGEMDEDKELKAYQLKTDCYRKSMEIEKEQERLLKEIAGDGGTIVSKVVSKDPEKYSIGAESMARRTK